MSNINNLTYANLTWIRDKAIPASKLKITQESLDVVVRARALILGFSYSPVACFSCSARSEFKVSQSVFEQYKQQINDRIAEYEADFAKLESYITDDENVENSQTFYLVVNDGESNETVENNAQDSTNSTLEFEDYEGDVMVEKIVSMESTENEISVTTKRGRKKNEE
jgi:hypothetical protein